MRKTIKVLFVIILTMPVCLFAQQREDKTFTGSENSNRNNSNNWNPPGVPT